MAKLKVLGYYESGKYMGRPFEIEIVLKQDYVKITKTYPQKDKLNIVDIKVEADDYVLEKLTIEDPERKVPEFLSIFDTAEVKWEYIGDGITRFRLIEDCRESVTFLVTLTFESNVVYNFEITTRDSPRIENLKLLRDKIDRLQSKLNEKEREQDSCKTLISHYEYLIKSGYDESKNGKKIDKLKEKMRDLSEEILDLKCELNKKRDEFNWGLKHD